MNFKIDHNNSYISNQNNLFILVSLFHINGFINNESLSALFKNLKEGRLNRNVNTYRSNITKEWYNDESIYEIFSDVFWKMLSPKGKQKIKLERLNKLRSIDGLPIKTYQTSLSFDEVLKYLNKYLNRNKNYCIDHLFFEFIKPLVESERTQDLTNMLDYNFSNFEKSYNSDDYYCCEYCCGEYENWLKSRNVYKYTVIKKDIYKKISQFLNTKRTKYKGSYKEFK